ncbi:hypothetical protein FRC98_20430 [Lujinxingia vulgaris]|uniref:BNR repeat domain protein n=1 Tax=Lujinxingia vulgaris TaxID=2600176 RepID=A0A5C6X8P7_9DELT|nr:hypothetical protein [Lujinxingia vulgaris]TXD33515.1 hypothetical protein FRC98_20430 [Lujinxingia vulgaris]
MTPLRRHLTALIALLALAAGCTTENSRACEIDSNCFNDEQCVAGFCQRRTEDPEDADANEPDANEPDTDANEPDADANEPDADANEPDADANEPDADANEPDADANETCPTGLDLCQETCVDLQTDQNFCGDCLTVCTDSQTCIGGTCTTEISFITVDPEPDAGFFNALALDSNGTPHVVYYADASRELRYASFNGAEWLRETINDDLDINSRVRLELDDTNTPHLAYLPADNLNVFPLSYATLTGDTWAVEPTAITEATSPIAFALGAENTPCVTTRKSLFNSLALSCRQTSGTWFEENLPLASDTTERIAIAGDGVGPIAITYKTDVNDFFFATRSSSGADSTPDLIATDANTANTLAITLTPGTSPIPVVASLTVSRTDLLIYRQSGSQWSSSSVPVSEQDTEAAATDVSLAATNERISAGLHITSSNHARVLHQPPSTATWQTLLNAPAHENSNTSVAIDAQGRTHALFVNPEGHLTYVLLP